MATILVVDDETQVRSALAALLEREGHEVVPAGDADEALERFDGVDAVITDVRMPGRDGVTLLEEILQHDPGMPVVLVTGYPTIDAAVHVMRLGAVDYVTKPFKRQRILDALDRVIERGHREDAVRAGREILERGVDHCLTVREVTDLYIDRVLELNGGNKVRAAKMLGINRRTIYRRRDREVGAS